jgi:nicotinamidase-related amidase
MAAWDRFLTQDDIKVLEKRKPRQLNGPGRRNALLLIDMQVTACGYDKPIYEQLDIYSGACGPHAWKAMPIQQTLLAAARKAGMPVIYSKHVFYPISGLPSAEPSNNFSALNANSEVPEEVAMQPGDLLVEKQTPSCFTFTNLPMMLKQLNIDGLLVGGNSTSGCVRATCVDGMALGYKMQVIEQAVFDRIEMSHAAALFDLQFKICDVISADAALAQIEGSAARTNAAA